MSKAISKLNRAYLIFYTIFGFSMFFNGVDAQDVNKLIIEREDDTLYVDIQSKWEAFILDQKIIEIQELEAFDYLSDFISLDQKSRNIWSEWGFLEDTFEPMLISENGKNSNREVYKNIGWRYGKITDSSRHILLGATFNWAHHDHWHEAIGFYKFLIACATHLQKVENLVIDLMIFHPKKGDQHHAMELASSRSKLEWAWIFDFDLFSIQPDSLNYYTFSIPHSMKESIDERRARISKNRDVDGVSRELARYMTSFLPLMDSTMSVKNLNRREKYNSKESSHLSFNRVGYPSFLLVSENVGNDIAFVNSSFDHPKLLSVMSSVVTATAHWLNSCCKVQSVVLQKVDGKMAYCIDRSEKASYFRYLYKRDEDLTWQELSFQQKTLQIVDFPLIDRHLGTQCLSENGWLSPVFWLDL
ncbi:MAG: hypothetical protein LAT68_14085 [Cyclobacteriaceae bacterium]|nr:hypothetical protein [Cyclobacteriaceae bacterium]MCH8517450.1 hypothetical protein [Cyclobacteriaceae bacterium]